MPDPPPTPVLEDSTFSEAEIAGLADWHSVSVADMGADLAVSDTSDVAKRNRNRAKGLIKLLQLLELE